MENILETISAKLIKGESIEELTQEALDKGISPKDILTKSLLEGMTRAGEMFKEKLLLCMMYWNLQRIWKRV